jgi:hypothetical protein
VISRDAAVYRGYVVPLEKENPETECKEGAEAIKRLKRNGAAMSLDLFSHGAK